MTYIKWRDADGYETGSRECLDLPAFAADLCKALHGKPISTNDCDGHAMFDLADGCRLSLSNKLAIKRGRQGHGAHRSARRTGPPQGLLISRLSTGCRLPSPCRRGCRSLPDRRLTSGTG